MTRHTPITACRSTYDQRETANGERVSPSGIAQPLQPYYSLSLGATIRPKNGPQDELSVTKILTYTVINAKLLIPGDGQPIPDASLVVEGKLIAWVGKQSDIPDKYTKKVRKTYKVPYLMPGLWDCHSHCLGNGPEEVNWPAYLGFVAASPVSCGARLTRQSWEALQRGYTSLRDVAGFGCELSKAINDGSIVGPNIYSSGACLSQLAGHGDVFALPAGDVLLNLGVSEIRPGHFASNPSCIVDGVEECRRGVRLQIRRGAKCIKVLASGGVMSSDDNPMYAQFSPEEMAVIVDEAKRLHRGVAAHCHGKPGIMAAIQAGVTTVEHVSFADQECIDLIKKRGIIYVATISVVRELLAMDPKDLPEENRKKAELVAGHQAEAYRSAIKAGVTIALGCDAPPGFNMAKEIEYAVEAGMSNLDALKAATANGPLSVQGQAPLTGQLKVGYEADFLGITENPVEDVKILQKIEDIKWVWKGGKLFKGPDVGPWGEDSN